MSYNGAMKRVLLLCLFLKYETTGVQQGPDTSPKLHSKLMAEFRLLPGSLLPAPLPCCASAFLPLTRDYHSVGLDQWFLYLVNRQHPQGATEHC